MLTKAHTPCLLTDEGSTHGLTKAKGKIASSIVKLTRHGYILSAKKAQFLKCIVLLRLQAESIKQVNELMREAGGLIKIEDVLPLFPDFVQIDAFKDAICQSLEEYNTQIEGLKSEMDDATRIADSLRCCTTLEILPQ